MGYTHYWEQYKELPIPEYEWVKMTLDLYKVLPRFIDKLDQITDQKLQINSNQVFFNGIGESAHETFVLDRVVDDECEHGLTKFSFCKTARKDYDVAVCCTLIIAKKHFGKLISISSDGDNEEWEEAKIICQDVLGYGENFDMSKTNGQFKEVIKI